MIIKEFSIDGLFKPDQYQLWHPSLYYRFFNLVDPEYYQIEKYRVLVKKLIFDEWIYSFHFTSSQNFDNQNYNDYAREVVNFDTVVNNKIRFFYYIGDLLGLTPIEILQKINSKISQLSDKNLIEFYQSLLLLEAFSPEFDLFDRNLLFRVHEILNSPDTSNPTENFKILPIKNLINAIELIIKMVESENEQMNTYISEYTILNNPRYAPILENIFEYIRFYKLHKSNLFKDKFSELRVKPTLTSAQKYVIYFIQALLVEINENPDAPLIYKQVKIPKAFELKPLAKETSTICKTLLSRSKTKSLSENPGLNEKF